MNSISKEDELIKIVEDAEQQYVHIQFQFISFIKVSEYKNHSNNELVVDKLDSDTTETKITQAIHLFQQYPITLFNDWLDFASIQAKTALLELKYPLPTIVSEPVQEVKKRIYLEVNTDIYGLTSAIRTSATKINDAMIILKNYADEYPHLHLRMTAILFRTKSACTWYDYLEKKRSGWMW